jgi:uncharacterized metal-binding protein YceD (DUF177 family)
MSEFSRTIPASHIDRAPLIRPIAANADERRLLARRLDLAALDRLEAKVTLRRISSTDILLTADMIAEATQHCVVTLEPLPAQIQESFRLVFREGIDEATADLLALEQPDSDLIEPVLADSIDIGEAVAQQLSLALDPFPRSPGAEDALAELGVVEITPRLESQ